MSFVQVKFSATLSFTAIVLEVVEYIGLGS